MLRNIKYAAIATFVLWLTAAAVRAQGAGTASPASIVEYAYHSVVPLGEDSLLLEPVKKSLYLLASAESREFEGWTEVNKGANRHLFTADGSPAQHYPEFIDFRVTASARPRPFASEPPYPIACQQGLNDYLLGLHFRLKIFRGIHMTVLEPKVVRLIGMPADVPYDERVYRVSFKLPDVPLDDRIMLEVLGPDGERISKFHLEFN